MPEFQLFLSNIPRISEIELNIVQQGGALDNYYIKWSNTISLNLLQIGAKK